MFVRIRIKKGMTEHVPLLLQRAHTPSNLVPPGCLRAWGRWGKKALNTGKGLGFSPLLLKSFSSLGKVAWQEGGGCGGGYVPAPLGSHHAFRRRQGWLGGTKPECCHS